MASRLVLAVAGSGKTRCIIEELDPNKRTLILTYTIANHQNILDRIISKFGYLPQSFHVRKYVSFLYGFCYQPFLQDALETKGLIFDRAPRYGNGLRRWVSIGGYLYNNRIFQLILNRVGGHELITRLNRFYDQVYVDEVQDFAGHDFDFIELLNEFNGNVLCVGDYYQHTFDTSTDGNKNGRLHSTYQEFVRRFTSAGYEVDTESLNHSWRCSPTVCRAVNNLGIEISSNKQNDSEVIRVTSENEVREIIENNSIIKLFRECSSNFEIRSMNWAVSKGIDHFKDVCVVLNNGTRDLWNNQDLENMNHRTKCKLYVAMTRANRNLFIVDESQVKKILRN
ncbi:DNA helicase UvrD [Aquimarina algiphila]|uniref:DNA helicase UvrD n=1 Tax=Aquimarina algiphila TaxID=2047982 RepID=UPI0024928819|nr:DNA helicase UvrD [Aquimarina algiphila]